jgi:hypothetical protein
VGGAVVVGGSAAVAASETDLLLATRPAVVPPAAEGRPDEPEVSTTAAPAGDDGRGSNGRDTLGETGSDADLGGW